MQPQRQYRFRAVDINSPRPGDSRFLRTAPRPVQVRILGPGEDETGVFLGPRYNQFHNITVPGQTLAGRSVMLHRLQQLGFFDDIEYPTVMDFIESLPHLHRREDVLFAKDIRTFNFLLAGWMKEGTFDFYRSSEVYDRIVFKLEKNRHATVPQRQTKYYRNAVDVVAEWP